MPRTDLSASSRTCCHCFSHSVEGWWHYFWGFVGPSHNRRDDAEGRFGSSGQGHKRKHRCQREMPREVISRAACMWPGRWTKKVAPVVPLLPWLRAVAGKALLGLWPSPSGAQHPTCKASTQALAVKPSFRIPNPRYFNGNVWQPASLYNLQAGLFNSFRRGLSWACVIY